MDGHPIDTASVPTLNAAAATSLPDRSGSFVRRRPQPPEIGALAAQVLDLLADAFIVLDEQSQLQVANRAARRLLDEDDGLSLEAGGPRAATVQETRLLRRAIAEVAAGTARSVRLSRPSGRPALSMIVAAPDDGTGQTVLSVADPGRVGGPDPERLQRLYGLTPMESRVAAHLAAGRSLPAISEALGITVQTVRGHLKQVFAKTGAHRQPELVHLLLTGPSRIVL